MVERLPLTIGQPDAEDDNWWDIVWQAWQCAESGQTERARGFYTLADSVLNEGCLNPSLSVLRHSVGAGSGTVIPVPATETSVVSFFLPSIRDADRVDIHGTPTEQITPASIDSFMDLFKPEIHWNNIKEPRQHIQVLSTGRCGTMSLYKLFAGSNLTPYHTYWFMPYMTSHLELMCRLCAGNFDDLGTADEWAECRAAEWLGDKPMIGLNHTDTIYAPVFAVVHPKAKFIHLRRASEKVFRSFIDKDQWGGGGHQLHPALYRFGEGFEFNLPAVEPSVGIRWHIGYTDMFARAFGEVMGDRYIEISADKLFAQDEDEINRLLEFTGSDISLDQAKRHFATKVNEKKHKINHTEMTDEHEFSTPNCPW